MRQDLDDINPLPRVTKSQLSQVLETSQKDTEEKVKLLTPRLFHDVVSEAFGIANRGTRMVLHNNRGIIHTGYSLTRKLVQIFLDILIGLSCSWAILLSAVPKFIIKCRRSEKFDLLYSNFILSLNRIKLTSEKTDSALNGVYRDRWTFK